MYYFLYIIYQVIINSSSNRTIKSNSKSLNPYTQHTQRKNEFVQKTHNKSISIQGSITNYAQNTRGKITYKRANWIPKGQCVTIQGYEIKDGMIYVGDILHDVNRFNNDASLINPTLQITPAEPWEVGDEMGYWPRYDNISKKCRGVYLKWLASGRSEPETSIGYVFLFFYGLERRLLLDGQNEGLSEIERMNIIEEARRLIEIYGENRSFRDYANNLLAMEWALYQNDKPIPSYIDFGSKYCTGAFQVALAQYVVAEQPIPAYIALQWVTLHPEFGIKTPARRCPNEFLSLFRCRYAHKFNEGIIVKPNKTPLKLSYYPANPSLYGDLELKTPNLPNPFILTAPLKKLSVLVESCTSELEAYSRYLGKKTTSSDSLAALSLLPKELITEWPLALRVKSALSQICEKKVN